MCTYKISLDDNLVAQTEDWLQGEIPFQLWLQQQVETFVRTQIKESSRKKHKHALTDEQLAKQLEKYKPLTMDDFPELSQSDYSHFLRRQSGRITKGLERWL